MAEPIRLVAAELVLVACGFLLAVSLDGESRTPVPESCPAVPITLTTTTRTIPRVTP